MIGQSATSAIRIIDGATMNSARRRSGRPRERRFVGVAGRGAVAASAMGDQKVSSADCISVCAFFSASAGGRLPASAALTFL